MAVIDSDAHVLETMHTWDYMLESERDMKPRIVPTPKDAASGGESWLVDGPLSWQSPQRRRRYFP
jgi:hypothetical protein